MFGSQALETAIGLVVLYFLLATVASMVVELVSTILSYRGRMLVKQIQSLVNEAKWGEFKSTSIWQAAQSASSHKSVKDAEGKTLVWRPSYLPSRSFAKAILEFSLEKDENGLKINWDKLDKDSLIGKYVLGMAQRGENQVDEIAAGIEQLFDDTMDRLEGAYKRVIRYGLLVLGFVLAVSTNSGSIYLAMDLWNDSATRDAVVAAADNLEQISVEEKEPADGPEDDSTVSLNDLAATLNTLDGMGLPIGWGDEVAEGQKGSVRFLGWLVTAALVALGAPFWFNLLTVLISLRSAGGKPSKAVDDDASATSRISNTVGVASDDGENLGGVASPGGPRRDSVSVSDKPIVEQGKSVSPPPAET